jgi:hypothetical protein
MLTPVADTTLAESDPDNNLGAQNFLEAGVIEPSGTLEPLRGLIRFDLSQIPTNAVISNATLRVSVVLTNTDAQFEYLELHRMLQPWTEGAGSGGTNEAGPFGAPALNGESTWNNRQHPGVAWASPGGGSGVDFIAAASSTFLVYSVSNYTISSGLVADVQKWASNGVTNFGWMLKASNEKFTTLADARRFGSREDAPHAPLLTVTYGIPRPVITTTSPLPTGTAGTAYSVTFFANGSTGPYSWSVNSGALPAGLALSNGGILSGIPTNAGAFNFNVRVADPAGESSTNSFALTINPGPLKVTTATLPDAVVTYPYSATLTASGGTPPYTWSLPSGPLSDAITLSGDGVFSGTPTNGNTRIRIEVQVEDSIHATATATLELTVESLALRLHGVQLDGNQISFLMTVNRGYTNVVQFRDRLDSGDWATLTNVTDTSTNAQRFADVTVTDTITNAQRFYRFYYLSPGSRK